jgi:hypothetical protein
MLDAHRRHAPDVDVRQVHNPKWRRELFGVNGGPREAAELNVPRRAVAVIEQIRLQWRLTLRRTLPEAATKHRP